ncbi:MAG: carboxypeptidase regulatory-like domain-containing protein [Oscillospiraceae bacterium]|jgi:Fe-S-cluster-containing dehydrogenase component|nr:carboxypeptidase regulatory-like domain-containing protein [Oscillospiraceae bacterium]
MPKVFTVDVSKCNGCYNCQLACKDEHVDNDWTPYAKPQPEIGQFWVKLRENVGGTIPKVKIHYIAQLCNHCKNAACVAACGYGAYYRREDGFVILDPGKCVGCRRCQSACPYGAIYYNEELNICQKCTGCAHLLDNGYKLPRCVEACPTDALGFGEESELGDFIVGSTVRLPETGCRPRVYYRNIPGRFIAGTVYDPVEKEIVEGAKVRATNGGKTYFQVTDEFGDFWFTDLAAGKYDVVIEAKGFEYRTFTAVDATADVNLGDIPLERPAEASGC